MEEAAAAVEVFPEAEWAEAAFPEVEAALAEVAAVLDVAEAALAEAVAVEEVVAALAEVITDQDQFIFIRGMDGKQ